MTSEGKNLTDEIAIALISEVAKDLREESGEVIFSELAQRCYLYAKLWIKERAKNENET